MELKELKNAAGAMILKAMLASMVPVIAVIGGVATATYFIVETALSGLTEANATTNLRLTDIQSRVDEQLSLGRETNSDLRDLQVSLASLDARLTAELTRVADDIGEIKTALRDISFIAPDTPGTVTRPRTFSVVFIAGQGDSGDLQPSVSKDSPTNPTSPLSGELLEAALDAGGPVEVFELDPSIVDASFRSDSADPVNVEIAGARLSAWEEVSERYLTQRQILDSQRTTQLNSDYSEFLRRQVAVAESVVGSQRARDFLYAEVADPSSWRGIWRTDVDIYPLTSEEAGVVIKRAHPAVSDVAITNVSLSTLYGSAVSAILSNEPTGKPLSMSALDLEQVARRFQYDGSPYLATIPAYAGSDSATFVVFGLGFRTLANHPIEVVFQAAKNSQHSIAATAGVGDMLTLIMGCTLSKDEIPLSRATKGLQVAFETICAPYQADNGATFKSLDAEPFEIEWRF